MPHLATVLSQGQSGPLRSLHQTTAKRDTIDYALRSVMRNGGQAKSGNGERNSCRIGPSKGDNSTNRWQSKRGDCYSLSFSNLKWNKDGECWDGYVTFVEQEYPTSIDFDCVEPAKDEQNAAIALADASFGALSTEWEIECRRQAARECTDCAYSQSDYNPTDTDYEELFQDMKLNSLSFTYFADEERVGGTLVYPAAKCFPDMRLQVNFLQDLSIDEVMILE